MFKLMSPTSLYVSKHFLLHPIPRGSPSVQGSWGQDNACHLPLPENHYRCRERTRCRPGHNRPTAPLRFPLRLGRSQARATIRTARNYTRRYAPHHRLTHSYLLYIYLYWMYDTQESRLFSSRASSAIRARSRCCSRAARIPRTRRSCRDYTARRSRTARTCSRPRSRLRASSRRTRRRRASRGPRRCCGVARTVSKDSTSSIRAHYLTSRRARTRRRARWRSKNAASSASRTCCRGTCLILSPGCVHRCAYFPG